HGTPRVSRYPAAPVPRVSVLVGLIVAACAVLASVAAANGRSDRDARRARLAYESMERIYLDPASGDYRQTPRGSGGWRAWPSSQALAAAIAVARLGNSRAPAARVVPARISELDRRFRIHGVYHAVPGGNVYYDDNEWIAQDLLDWDSLRHSP